MGESGHLLGNFTLIEFPLKPTGQVGKPWVTFYWLVEESSRTRCKMLVVGLASEKLTDRMVTPHRHHHHHHHYHHHRDRLSPGGVEVVLVGGGSAMLGGTCEQVQIDRLPRSTVILA